MQSLRVIAHACFHDQHADLVLHLHNLPNQQAALSRRAARFANRRRGHVAFRQKIAAREVASFAGVHVIVLLFRHGNGSRHQRVATFNASALAASDRRPTRRKPWPPSAVLHGLHGGAFLVSRNQVRSLS